MSYDGFYIEIKEKYIFIPQEIKMIILSFLTEFNHIYAIEKNPRRYQHFRLYNKHHVSSVYWKELASELHELTNLYIDNKYSFWHHSTGVFNIEYKYPLKFCIKRIKTPESFFIYTKKNYSIKKLISKPVYKKLK